MYVEWFYEIWQYAGPQHPDPHVTMTGQTTASWIHGLISPCISHI